MALSYPATLGLRVIPLGLVSTHPAKKRIAATSSVEDASCGVETPLLPFYTYSNSWKSRFSEHLFLHGAEEPASSVNLDLALVHVIAT